jgi:hypothetical protein
MPMPFSESTFGQPTPKSERVSFGELELQSAVTVTTDLSQHEPHFSQHEPQPQTGFFGQQNPQSSITDPQASITATPDPSQAGKEFKVMTDCFVRVPSSQLGISSSNSSLGSESAFPLHEERAKQTKEFKSIGAVLEKLETIFQDWAHNFAKFGVSENLESEKRYIETIMIYMSILKKNINKTYKGENNL